jgi:hypothetical protein
MGIAHDLKKAATCLPDNPRLSCPQNMQYRLMGQSNSAAIPPQPVAKPAAMARVFQSVLGLTLENADVLIAVLRQAVVHGEAVTVKRDKHGQRYIIDFEFSGPAGTAMIRSAWIIRLNESVPRLVTCFIL